ncbi:MAG: GNAT family N-acetyltransferase [Clostridiales bacterium]|nr:GNAT family N-acetyltransferase [Clostridiales bacterium]
MNITIELIPETEIYEVCETVARACKQSTFAEFYPPLPQYFSIAPEEIKQKAESGHFYVVKDSGKIIGCGGIGAYWDSLTEGWINTIFVDPAYQRQGIGRKLIKFLERDEYAKRARRIEIHSSVSAIPFYRKLGYEHKDGQLCYHDGMFDLEKILRTIEVKTNGDDG